MTIAAPQDGSASRILVATDFSTRSDRALRRATLIAKRLGASLSLVHVVEADQPRQMIETRRAEALLLLAETIGTSCEADGVSANYQVVVDDTASGILSAADEAGADLIVLGPHRSHYRDLFSGTTVERVVRRSRTPVLVAIQPPSALYQRTLLAVDFDEASKAAVRGALRLGVFEQTAVTVMHAFDAGAVGMLQRSKTVPGAAENYLASEQLATVKQLQDFSEALGLPATRRSVVAIKGTPARSIIESARDERADLILVGTTQKHSATQLLIGSVMEQVLRDAERDILIIPSDQDDDASTLPPVRSDEN